MRQKLFKRRSLCIVYGATLILFTMVFMPFLCGMGSAATGDEELAAQYAPILYFEDEETCYPVNVSYHIQNSYLKIFGDNNFSYSLEDYSDLSELDNFSFNISDINEHLYLDNQKGTVDNYEGIINDYQDRLTELGYNIYYRVYNSGDTKVIQYWMFYAFNLGELNQHEGDWEMVQVVISSDVPTEVMYSQHYSGRRAIWDQVERNGNHIKVYVARGSHANYFRSYSGKFGISNDIVDDNGKVLKPSDYNLILLDSQIWLDFPGRWGEFNTYEDIVLGRAGPLGPKFRENGDMWNNPISWSNSLQQVDDNLFTIQWFTYNFSEIYILLTLLLILIIGFGIYWRHRKYGLGPRIFSILYIDGVNLKSIGNVLCILGIIVIIFALFQTWYQASYMISGDTGDISFATEETMNLLTIDGINGIQFYVPSASGSVPFYNVAIPFALIIGIGLIFFILTTIGRYRSWKLGWKYLFRGIKVIFPVVLILIGIILIGVVLTEMTPPTGDTSVDNSIVQLLNDISGAPMGGHGMIIIPQGDTEVRVDIQWGLGNGGKILLLAGFIFIFAGILEIASHTKFFEPKMVKKSRKEKRKEKAKKLNETSEFTNDEYKSEVSKAEQTTEEKNE